jgi:hypothetical protein
VSRADPGFSRNVFINCPFDSDYIALLRPLLFTVLYIGFIPRIASERLDSGEPRIDKIVELIQRSKFSIHDLSRIESSNKEELYRLNMAFELGVDFGCRFFAEGEPKSKKFLILEKERYRYQKALSDLSGSDIKNHNNEPEDLVREVRNWFVEITSLRPTGGTRIWEDFNEFMADFRQKREKQGYSGKDLETMPTQEYVDLIKEWLGDRGIVKSS